MIVTVLIEDTCLKKKELIAEHGLSIHIDWDGKQILFDTGATDAFSHNAEKLGININEIDISILSHHHYDHGGGLDCFLNKNKKSQIYFRNKEPAKCYYRPFGFMNRYVGLNRNLIRSYQNRFEYIDECREISPDIFLFSDISNHYPLPKGNRYLFVKEGNRFRFDDFRHEVIMVLKDKDGLVVFTGCSHQGILNMIKTVNDHFQGFPLKAVFGGFHLVKRKIFNTLIDSKNEIRKIGQEIQKYPIQKIYTGHCTAAKAFQVLKKSLREKLDSFSTGSIIEIH